VRKHIIPGLGRIRLGSLSPAHLQSYYSSKCASGLAPRTVHYHHTLLNQALKWGYLRRNVAAVVDPPKAEKKEMNPLSAAQVKAILEAAKGDRLEAFYLLAVSTGMRLGELQALKWADIDLRERTLSVNRTLSATKGGPVFGPPKTSRSRRKIFLSRKSVEASRRHRERQATEKEDLGDRWHDEDLVFCSVVGTPLSRHNLGSRSFKPLLRRANLPSLWWSPSVVSRHPAPGTATQLWWRCGGRDECRVVSQFAARPFAFAPSWALHFPRIRRPLPPCPKPTFAKRDEKTASDGTTAPLPCFSCRLQIKVT
jgi:integrase